MDCNRKINSNYYCVIMAGGIGSRFWPLSRVECPKQFIDALGVGKTFIQLTYERFAQFIPKENFLVVTGDVYKSLVLEQLPMLLPSQILTEPCRRNTAPCIAYAMYKLYSVQPDATVIVTPSDQYIANEKEFISIMQKNLQYAALHTALLTIGITPSFPAVGYGYIQTELKDSCSITKVVHFKEKPDVATAMEYLASGNYYWNSGIFIWSVPVIIEAFQRYLPEVSSLFEDILCYCGTPLEQDMVNKAFLHSPNISIDYGVMEKAENVYVYCNGGLGWSDVGTWGALYELASIDANGNTMDNRLVRYTNSDGVLVKEINPKKHVFIDGLSNFLVVDTGDVLMICPRKDEKYIQNLIEGITKRR